MTFLLVDNSNTRTKFASASAETLSGWQSIIPTKNITEDNLESLLSDQSWDAAIVSSVVPEKSHILASYFNKIGPCLLISHQSNLPIDIDYPKPEQIGADRLANAAAAFTLFGSPCVVLDFGTAVTFDIISKEKEKSLYKGGVIAPGLASMTEGLARRTALLPHIQLEEPKNVIGKSTEEAMLAGAIYGYRGLVREILTQIEKELQETPTIIATGGDAALIIKGLPEICHHSPQLTLEGLRIIANLHF
ncbi:MAG TPA: type III pantothenate kinase [Verrucomicrobiales bacterium]|nr:type III pantothenate kinase [Verrucomicrobiales bacterium]